MNSIIQENLKIQEFYESTFKSIFINIFVLVYISKKRSNDIYTHNILQLIKIFHMDLEINSVIITTEKLIFLIYYRRKTRIKQFQAYQNPLKIISSLNSING